MGPRTVGVGGELGGLIRVRRQELELTIEQAAANAGIGTETWRRYETGSAIRRDKVSGVCKALRIKSLYELEQEGDLDGIEGLESPGSYWEGIEPDQRLRWLDWMHGSDLAKAAQIGLDLVDDQIRMAIEDLHDKPRGTHIGQVTNMLSGTLPARWLHRYDYEFFWRLRAALGKLRLRFLEPGYDGSELLSRTPVDHLLIYLVLIDGAWPLLDDPHGAVDERTVDGWVGDLTGDDDLEVWMLMNSSTYDPSPDDQLHFDNWFRSAVNT